MSYEMGLKPFEVKRLTIVEFTLMAEGRNRRIEEQWNHTRHIMTYVANYGGMGREKPMKPSDIIKLRIDGEGEIKHVTSLHQALELLRGFE